MSNTVPYNKQVSMAYYDTDTYQFQLLENGEPVSENLTTQIFKFFIRNGRDEFTDIEKNIVTEGWVVDNVNKIIKVVVNTVTYGMLAFDASQERYFGRLEWIDRKMILVMFTIDVNPQVLWGV